MQRQQCFLLDAMRFDSVAFGSIWTFVLVVGLSQKTKSWKKIETKKWRTILLIDSLAKRTAAGPTKAKSRKV